MTNKEKFVEVFGDECYNNFVGVAKEANAIDIFVWLLKDYIAINGKPGMFKEPYHLDESKFTDPIPEDIFNKAIQDTKPKSSRRGGARPGRGYDLKWYMDAVSDFYLGSAKNIEFKVSDDRSSGKKVNTIDGFKSRFIVAVKELELDEEIWVHKYYQGTCNECVCLEKPNFKNFKAAGYSNMR